MLKPVFVAIAMCCGGLAIADDTTDRDAVVQVITNFFHAMTMRDVDAMRALMTEDGMIYGYREGDDGLQVIRRPHAEYLAGLEAGEGQLLERFWKPEVMVYGRLATAWTPYDFYANGSFSHCGVNNFSLLRTDERWVIAGVVFSIEADCGESPLGPPDLE